MPVIIDQAALIGGVIATLARDAPMPIYDSYSPMLVPVEPAAFAMVVGAGFSFGAEPMVAELMLERIGHYYFPDQDMSSLERPPSVCRKNSAGFWREFIAVAAKVGRPEVTLNNRHLPVDCAAAYNRLFDYEVANMLFADHRVDHNWYRGYIGKLRLARGDPPPPAPPGNATLGSRFVRGFLRYVLAPGVEHGFGVSGRGQSNAAHLQLAALLAAQQVGRLGALQPFCRTILTTKFDSLLQSALAVEQVVPIVSNRPEFGFDAAMFEPAIGPIHIVHLHGSVLRGNPASSSAELSELARTNAQVLGDFLAMRHVLVVGHSGWNDAFVAALRLRETDRTLYWCDMAAAPSDRITEVLGSAQRPAVYVQLGKGGADTLMTAFNEALRAAQPVSARPRYSRPRDAWSGTGSRFVQRALRPAAFRQIAQDHERLIGVEAGMSPPRRPAVQFRPDRMAAVGIDLEPLVPPRRRNCEKRGKPPLAAFNVPRDADLCAAGAAARR